MDKEKEKRAIQYLKSFEPSEGYHLCYSGGKDSDAIRILASLANVKHDIVNNHTTVDAPETVYYIRSIPNVQIVKPKKTMWELIEQNLTPPTRLMRYCCSELKEKGGEGRLKITGVRWQESRNRAHNNDVVTIKDRTKRLRKQAEEMEVDAYEVEKGGLVMNMDNDKNRRFVEHCYRTSQILINPIIDWTEDDVWEFLNHYGCKSNPLYQCGYKRIGCEGCPMAGKNDRYEQFKRYPKYKNQYINSFKKMLENRKLKGIETNFWENDIDVFRWWMNEDVKQIRIEDLYEV